MPRSQPDPATKGYMDVALYLLNSLFFAESELKLHIIYGPELRANSHQLTLVCFVDTITLFNHVPRLTLFLFCGLHDSNEQKNSFPCSHAYPWNEATEHTSLGQHDITTK